jgi:hypothetical protein
VISKNARVDKLENEKKGVEHLLNNTRDNERGQLEKLQNDLSLERESSIQNRTQ